MQLIRIYSNKNSFKSIEFNRNGLSFIIAKQKNPNQNDSGKTYNGVGKSLLVNIIHFCLGSSKKKYESFCDKLPDWEFYLDFEVSGISYKAKRTTNNPNQIILNNEELTIKKFNEKLEQICFSIPDSVSTLSFRSLIPFFIRPNKKWYVSFSGESHSQYNTMLFNSFLLGLNIFLAEKKYVLRKEQERIKELEKNFKNDDLLRDFFTGNKDVSLAILDLEEKIKALDEDLKGFRVADDYSEVQFNADKIENQLFELNNQIILLQNNIDTINKSLEIESNTSQEDIRKVYEEANIYFSEFLSKTLTELETFYENLVLNRKKRLLEQRTKLESERESKSVLAKKLKNNLDNLMKYLGDHQALDLFLSLSDTRAQYKTKLENLEKYQCLQSEYKDKMRDNEKNQIQQSEKTDEFLQLVDSNILELKNYFRLLAKRFYPNSISGLTIENNDGDNQQRYNIDAKIESDNSDGINNVKIFCYDMTLLFKGQNHNIDFIFHDSRLYDGIDERQKSELFKIVYEEFKSSEKQYIATVNQNQLNEIQNSLSKEEFQTIIINNTVLELTDDSDLDKLLGITVDIDFN